MSETLLKQAVDNLLKVTNDNTDNYYQEEKKKLYYGAKLPSLYNLEMAKSLGLNMRYAIDLTNKFSGKFDNMSSLLIEIAGMLRSGLLGSEVYELLTDDSLGKRAGDLAVKILESKGVYFKKASLSKNSEFRVTEGRNRFRLFPIMDSANSLSKNTTSKEFKTNNSMSPSVELQVLIDLNIISNSRSLRELHSAILNEIKNKTDIDFVKHLRDLETTYFVNYISAGISKVKDGEQFVTDMKQMFGIVFKSESGNNKNVIENAYKYFVNTYEYNPNGSMEKINAFEKAV